MGGFFRLALSHIELRDYFVITFQLTHHHNYSFGELGNLIPWERDIYLNQIKAYIDEENRKLVEKQGMFK
ncbi:hypothetical protein CL614_04645 [archaeon]|nr:hypothetical protein [archaeon]